MTELLDDVRSQLRRVFAGRSVILMGGFASGAVRSVDQLRQLGATRFLVVCSGVGTGGAPDGPDVELMIYDSGIANDSIEGFRNEERAIECPSDAVLERVRRFDPRGDAIAIAPPFLDVRQLADRRLFGARRSEWVALEDKTIADELFDSVGVARPRAAVVRADAESITGVAAVLDRGMGTVWAGDARGGFNGGGEYVRWVRDAADHREALAHLLPRCDRVRVAEFVEGVPCSIHGFVLDDGIAVFRPVELVTLRAPSPPRLRYCGCATFFDPAPAQLESMRTAVRAVGESLRASAGFRGAFTLDGIASAGGWVATECNPRFGAGLGYADAARPELCLLMLHHAVIEGVADVPSGRLEAVVVEAADRTRWGGAWTQTAREFRDTERRPLVCGPDGFRFATGTEPADAVLVLGPGRGDSGHVRIEPDPGRTPHGPSIAARSVAGFAFADRELDLGLGPLTPAQPAA